MSAVDPIPADVRARLRNLRLRGRHGAGGDGFGQHQSGRRGAGHGDDRERRCGDGEHPPHRETGVASCGSRSKPLVTARRAVDGKGRSR